MALGLLSGIAPPELWQAVRAGDAGRLTRIPGVGKKTATRLVVELEGKLPQPDGGAAQTYSPQESDAMSALLNLGYAEAQARKALDEALRILGPEPGLRDLLKTALRAAGGGERSN
jgi:Holliday junction DNA helicase RuvA